MNITRQDTLKTILAILLFFIIAIPSCAVINSRLDAQDQAQTAMIDAYKAEIKATANKDEAL